MPKPKVLVVEDEPTILENVLYAFSTEGFAPTGFSTGGEALEALDDNTFDLAILDVGLPDTTGFELCKTIRATSSIPIIFLTARSSEIDRIVGLEIGGDDYVVKPFSPRELAARAKAVLRRCSPQPESTSLPVSTATLAIDQDRARITFHGTLLDLSSTEYKLLITLCAQPGRVYSRSQLMDHAWEDPASALERTVDAHIKTIRSKLKTAHPEAQDPITTHRGLGYSMAES